VASRPLHLYQEAIALGDPRDVAGAPAAEELAPDRVAAVLGRPVLCSGTILGSPAACERLLERMLALQAVPPGRFQRVLDQGALNLLAHTGALDDLEPAVHPLGGGGVVTAGVLAGRPELHVAGDGVRWSDETPPVVHQYDRIPGLADVYRSRYG
jgi:hypothetical protein